MRFRADAFITMPSLRSLLRLACLWLLLQAGRAAAEPLLVSVEGAAALALTSPQSERFGPGAAASVMLAYPVAPALLLGARLRTGFLSDGAAPAARTNLADPGVGTLHAATLVVRLRPFAFADGVQRATGLFIDAAGGGGLTGELTRGTFEAGLGYGFGMGALSVAPTLRYVQVMQPTDPLSRRDARLLMLGIELTLFDARQKAVTVPTSKLPTDRDHDGISDLHDECPDQPEDFDGKDDADGCPDADNDGDRIPDVSDACPDQPEDFDEWEDADGCPDPDNDFDTFLDADDQCPNEAEIINGNKDYDGCPDDGLIELKNDRIVLEERVLFDFERARVKREARPILRAIARLKEQHPEWIKVRIEGHADAQGDAAFNQALSERRANNVMRALVRLGIPSGVIESVGYGSTHLRDKREDAEANARNRRVEFVVVARGVSPTGAAAPEDEQTEDEQTEDEQAEDEQAEEEQAEEERAPTRVVPETKP